MESATRARRRTGWGDGGELHPSHAKKRSVHSVSGRSDGADIGGADETLRSDARRNRQPSRELSALAPPPPTRRHPPNPRERGWCPRAGSRARACAQERERERGRPATRPHHRDRHEGGGRGTLGSQVSRAYARATGGGRRSRRGGRAPEVTDAAASRVGGTAAKARAAPPRVASLKIHPPSLSSGPPVGVRYAGSRVR